MNSVNQTSYPFFLFLEFFQSVGQSSEQYSELEKIIIISELHIVRQEEPFLTTSLPLHNQALNLLSLTLQYSLIGSFLLNATSRTWLLPKMILPASITFQLINFQLIPHNTMLFLTNSSAKMTFLGCTLCQKKLILKSLSFYLHWVKDILKTYSVYLLACFQSKRDILKDEHTL